MTEAGVQPRPILLIPAFNEGAHLAAVLEGVNQAAPDFEIVVVDDGSTDATARVAEEKGAVVLRHPFNLGYGAALQTGYKYAVDCGARMLVQMDGDGQHDPAEAVSLLGPVRADEADLVLGSRFSERSGYRMGALRSLGRQLFRGIGRLTGLQVTDPTSGFQALNARVLKIYIEDAFPVDFPDVDVLIAVHRAGLRIAELPVQMSEGFRPSLLHGGLRPIYYVYKMLLATWTATTASEPRNQHGENDE